MKQFRSLNMKLNMKIICLLMFAFAASITSAQSPAPLDKKVEKEHLKAKKKAAELEQKNMTVDFLQLIKFPSFHVGKPSRVARVALGDIRPITESGMTYYLVEVNGSDDFTMAVPLPDRVTFVLSETMARSVSAELTAIRKGSDKPLADLYFQMLRNEYDGRVYFPAAVTCIAFVEQSKNAYGNCPLIN